MAAPTSEAIAAILESSSVITRRVEILESDAITPFAPTQNSALRLIEGAVTVDYGRAERRAMDLTLDNADGLLNHDPDGFWYDKIIKVYRGVEYLRPRAIPRVLVIDDATSEQRLRLILGELGFSDVTYNLSASTLAHFEGYDIIASDNETGTMTGPRATLLKAAYDAGRAVLTIGNETTSTQLPHMIAATDDKTGDEPWRVSPYVLDNPLATGWTTETAGGLGGSWMDLGDDWLESPDWFGEPDDPVYGELPLVLAGTTRPAGIWVLGSQTYYTAIYDSNAVGGRWVHFQYGQEPKAQMKRLYGAAVTWLQNWQARGSWESCIGVFMIDKIDEDNFPSKIKVVGRDLTKACLLAKISKATGWAEGTRIRNIVIAMLTKSGITAYNVPSSISETLETMVVYAKNTECWKIIKEVCDAHNYECYFDADGVFQMREYQDPVLSPATMVFRADEDGNLVRYKKSSNDTRIFNKIVATGVADSAQANDLLVYAELSNTEPSSPTRIKVPGVPGGMSERTFPYESVMFTTNAKALAYCRRAIKILALEEYSLDFDSLVFSWLEGGDVVEFLDPDDATSVFPKRFLLTNLSIPLTLGPMSGSAKRVSVVGSAA